MNAIPARRDIWFYAVLALPLAFAGLPLYIHMPDFYARATGAGLAALGGLLLAVRLFDAVQDPFIGWLSDRFATRRRFLCMAGTVGLGVSFAALFHPVAAWGLWWPGLWLVLASSFFSLAAINLNAFGSLWHRDGVQKARIAGAREMMALAGLLGAVVLPAVLVLWLPLAAAFSVYALIMVVLCILAVFLFRVPPVPIVTVQSFKMRDILFCLQGETGRFMFVYGLSMLASAFPAVTVIFFIRDRLGLGDMTGLFLGLYIAAAIAAIPLWTWLSRRYDMRWPWLWAMLLAAAALACAMFLQPGAVIAYAVICVLTGWALGAELALPPALLSMAIDRDDAAARTGTYFAVMGFCTKLSLALAGALALFILGRAGFVPDETNAADALAILGGLYALLPVLLKILAAAALLGWMSHDRKDRVYESVETSGVDRGNRYA